MDKNAVDVVGIVGMVAIVAIVFGRPFFIRRTRQDTAVGIGGNGQSSFKEFEPALPPSGVTKRPQKLPARGAAD